MIREISRELTPNAKEYQKYLIEGFDGIFKKKDEKTYISKSGIFFRLDFLGNDYQAFVLEYALDDEEYKNNIFEDGDLFYLEDYTKEEMLLAMIEEIEN